MATRIEQAAAVVDAARAMLANLGSLALAPDSEIVDLLAHTATLTRVIDAQRVRLAGEVDKRSKGPAEDSLARGMGSRSPKEAVATALGIREVDASSLLRVARLTSSEVSVSGGEIPVPFPHVATALQGGKLTLEQAKAITQSLEPAAPQADPQQLEWAEQQLVEAATNAHAPMVPELLVTQGKVYAAVLDPDGVLPNDERLRAERSFKTWQQRNGSWVTRIVSPPEDGSAVKTMVDAGSSPRRHVAFVDDPCSPDCTGTKPGDGSSSCTCSRSGGESDATVHDADAEGAAVGEVVDLRTPEQRRYDAFMGFVRAQAGAPGAPTAGGEAPVLILTGTIEAYDAMMRDIEHPDRTLTIPHTGAIVPIETARRLACHAVVQRAIVDEDGHVLRLGREQRLFSKWQRRALALRDKGCRAPGCRMPANWCEAHHVTWWELGGLTDLDNGILVCSFHHHEIHAGRLLVQRAGDGPGAWRIVANLRPGDRYARARRSRPAPKTAACSAAASDARLIRLPSSPGKRRDGAPPHAAPSPASPLPPFSPRSRAARSTKGTVPSASPSQLARPARPANGTSPPPARPTSSPRHRPRTTAGPALPGSLRSPPSARAAPPNA